MWDTTTRIPFDAVLLTERGGAESRAQLLRLIASRPGISMDELHGMRLPGLFAGLRSLHRAGLICTDSATPRFFERGTRVFPVDGGSSGA
ncbi:hypothetical protein DOE76_13290 [Leifsonia sp. ku-ls]|nr:hypothetical protein DOE76_13290 [Leifsonia sp. ku-ls]